MTDFNRLESGKFALVSDDVLGKLTGQVDAALEENAGKGFSLPSGDVLETILAATHDAKGKLTEANGKIYDDQRGVIFQKAEFALKLLVQIAKLAMELYREDLLNALMVEAAQVETAKDMRQGDIERMNADIEKRQVAVIQNRAEAERRINILKAELVQVEAARIGKEEILIQAQLATAEKKLEIIDSIYKVLAAEQLVLAAENRRAASLQDLLVAQQIVAEIKKEMVPLYISKAKAREDLADAIVAEIPVREALERLGYDRIALKDSEEAAKHLIRSAEDQFELSREIWTQANKTTELARTQSRRLLQEYANQVRDVILDKKQTLEENGIDLRLDTSLARHQITVDAEKTQNAREIFNLGAEIINILENITKRSRAHVAAIQATANVTEQIYSDAKNFRWQTVI